VGPGLFAREKKENMCTNEVGMPHACAMKPKCEMVTEDVC
jgi:hypothetical protein